MFTPLESDEVLKPALARLDRRKATTLLVSTAGIECSEQETGSASAGWRGTAFALVVAPRLHMLVYGQGEELLALCRLSNQFGAGVTAFSPSDRDAIALNADGIETSTIRSPASFEHQAGDPWSAVVFIFHDRDWEERLLPAALDIDAFYHGAVGSPRTHAARLDMLSGAGVNINAIRRLKGMIGLIPSTRDPSTLAVSILAEVAGEYHSICMPPPAIPAPHGLAETG